MSKQTVVVDTDPRKGQFLGIRRGYILNYPVEDIKIPIGVLNRVGYHYQISQGVCRVSSQFRNLPQQSGNREIGAENIPIDDEQIVGRP